MLRTFFGICYYVVIDIPGMLWRATVGSNFLKTWWRARYH